MSRRIRNVIAPPSPKQLMQRERYIFKGFVVGTQGRINDMMKSKAVSIREKCHMATMLHELSIILRDCDMQSALYIKEAK